MNRSEPGDSGGSAAAGAFRIDRVAEADLPRVRELARCIWPVSYAGMIPPGQIDYMLDWMYSLERLSLDFRAGVVFEWPTFDGVPIGYLATSRDSFASDGPVLFLHKLYLLPGFQGRGLGARLLDHVLHSAVGAGCRRVRLNVNKSNARAIACYRRHGFVVEASVVNDIGGGFVMDDHVMARPVPGAASA